MARVSSPLPFSFTLFPNLCLSCRQTNLRGIILSNRNSNVSIILSYTQTHVEIRKVFSFHLRIRFIRLGREDLFQDLKILSRCQWSPLIPDNPHEHSNKKKQKYFAKQHHSKYRNILSHTSTENRCYKRKDNTANVFILCYSNFGG